MKELTREQLEVVMPLYEEESTKARVEEVFQRPFEEVKKMSFYPLIRDCMSEAFLKGMELSASPKKLVEFYENNIASLDVPYAFEYEENKGVCGVLLPSGDFLQCREGDHHTLDLDGAEHTSMYFSSKLNGKEGVVSISPFSGKRTLTAGQTHWLEHHGKYMDEAQLQMVIIKTGGIIGW